MFKFGDSTVLPFLSECKPDPSAKLVCSKDRCMYIHQSKTRLEPHDDWILNKCRKSEPTEVVVDGNTADLEGIM